MNKLALAVASLLAAALLAATPNAAGAATTATASGLCHSGATWNIAASRSGDKVKATFTAAPLPVGSPWNVNAAWTPINQVGNATVKADKNGRVTYKAQVTSRNTVTVYIWIDWQGSVFNCLAAVTL